MPTFKDLWIWQESHQLSIEIFEFLKKLPAKEEYREKDQVERSSASIPGNIAEGYSAYYYKEKIKGMLIARKETGETINHIESLTAKKYLDRTQADNWTSRYEKVLKGINGFVKHIRNKMEKDSSDS